MGGICRIKGKEKGLWFEIQCLENIINSPTASEKDKAHARKILPYYKKLKQSDYDRASIR